MEKGWGSKICRALYPLAWLYGCGVWVRNRLFDRGILCERRFPLPVIAVGNLTVGGTGKTPHTEYLIRLLQSRFRVAVLSRGYKRRSKGFVLARPDTPVQLIGDEPYQMKAKYPSIRMAVDRDRCRGIEQLCAPGGAPDTEVVILDDAFQHRYVKPGLNLLLVDYNRPIDRDALLPAGRLREPASGRRRADGVIVTKCPAGLPASAQEAFAKRLALAPSQRLFFTSLVYGDLYPLENRERVLPLAAIGKDMHLLVVTGIASPDKLVRDLQPYCAHVGSLAFGDHHAFTEGDARKVGERFGGLPEGRRMIVTTEKDATRIAVAPGWGALCRHIYVLPVEVAFLHGQEELFNSMIIDYVRKDSRNSSFSEREDAYHSRDSHHPGNGTGQLGT